MIHLPEALVWTSIMYLWCHTQYKVQSNLLILIRAFQPSWAQSYTHRHRVWEKHPQAVPLFWILWEVFVWTLMAASLGSLACGICRVLTESSCWGICVLSYRNIKHVSSWAGEMDLWLRTCIFCIEPELNPRYRFGMSYNHLWLQFPEIWCLLWPPQATVPVPYAPPNRMNLLKKQLPFSS